LLQDRPYNTITCHLYLLVILILCYGQKVLKRCNPFLFLLSLMC